MRKKESEQKEKHHPYREISQGRGNLRRRLGREQNLGEKKRAGLAERPGEGGGGGRILKFSDKVLDRSYLCNLAGGGEGDRGGRKRGSIS